METPQHTANQTEFNNRWLMDNATEIATDNSVVDPNSLGLRKVDENVTVPAVFEIPAADGGMDKIAVVRREIAGRPAEIALHGLVRNRKGALKVASRRGVTIQAPSVEDGPIQIEVGNAAQDISRGKLFGVGRFKRGKRQFSDSIGDQALNLMITPEGGVFASSTAEDQHVARMEARAIHHHRARGRVAIDSFNDPRHAEYISPQQRRAQWQEQQRQAQEQEAANRKLAAEREAERVRRIFAPRHVPDLTAGEYAPANYDGLRVTDESRGYSRQWLQRSLLFDNDLRTILQEATGQAIASRSNQSLDQAIDAIRTNGDLRMRLGNLYRDRVDASVHLMGDNIRSRNIKKPNSPGYEGLSMRGPEYAAALALSHLDGTFDPRRESTLVSMDEVNEFGWPLIDQHRAAARFALDRKTWQDRQAELAAAAAAKANK